MSVTILHGDALEVLRTLPAESVQACVTSPPYWRLRDYGIAGQMGLEKTPEAYVEKLVMVFDEVRRVLRPDGTLWLNLGDSYAGSWGNQGRKAERGRQRPINGPMLTAVHDDRYPSKSSNTGSVPISIYGIKPKDLVGIPWRVAFALHAAGWYLRCDVVWSKPNPMPESVRDRPTRSHEYVFLLSKSARYFYDADAIAEPASYGVPNSPKSIKSTHGQGFTRLAKRDKQRGHSRRHEGFNELWDAMSKAEQRSGLRNKRSVWTMATRPSREEHFATFPPELPALCIRASTREGDMVLDPFGGTGTTGLVADRLGRDATLVELNPKDVATARRRIVADAPLLAEVNE